ncbi:MAG: hypothetical protein KAJ23_16975 [Maribacter sp.]|nr:hypothetical protein [Maribacter sp.]
MDLLVKGIIFLLCITLVLIRAEGLLRLDAAKEKTWDGHFEKECDDAVAILAGNFFKKH